MASYFDSPNTMKVEKTSYDALKKSIFEVSLSLGSGTTNAVPYDTAWVARIPKSNDISSPAFPECLQWLRDHQREDGSWGAIHPHSLHCDILNTFAAVLALSQWNYSQDEERKKKAIEALTILAKKLPEIGTRDKIFEMIMSGLLADAREFELVVPYEQFEWCSKTGKKELQEAEDKIMSNTPNKYWTLLEATDRTLDLELENFRSDITKFGIIAAQPSTTAYVLRFARLRGSNFPEAEWALKKLCDRNGGGVPHFSLSDNFEIIYGLDFLFKAGINPRINVKYAVTENALNTLKGRLSTNDGIGFSSNWKVSDSECLLTALHVLHQTLERNNEQGVGEKTCGFETPPTKKSKISIKEGLLENYTGMLEKNSVAEHTTDFSKTKVFKELCSVNKAFLEGKRNVSMHYSIFQSVFDLTHEAKSVTEILKVIRSGQNDDGGWGEQGKSTVEETAYVCLAIYRLVQTQKGVVESINFSELIDFMNNASTRLENECFWCYKVNFCSPVVTDAAISAAKYALRQIRKLCVLKDALTENQNIHFLASEPWNVNNQLINPGYFLLTGPEIPRYEIEVSKQEVMKIFDDVFHSKQDDYLRALVDTCLELSYVSYPEKLTPYDRTIDTFLPALFFVIDYVFDVFLQKKNNFSEEVDKLFSVLGQILKGEYTHLNQVPTVSFPKFSLLAEWCYCFRRVMEEKGWNADLFVKYLETNMFHGFSLSYKLERYDIDCTSKRYLQVHKFDVGNREILCLRCNLAGKMEGLTEFEHSELFVKYIDCADKVGRLHHDISTIAKDVRLSRPDNYCIKLQDEYQISLHKAAVRAARKCNRKVLKMFRLKKLILQDPKFKNNETLHFIFRQVEYGLDGGLLWSISSPRYGTQPKFAVSKQLHNKKIDLLSIQNLCFGENKNIA